MTLYRYISRSLFIEFAPPMLDILPSTYAKIPSLIKHCSSSVGLIVSLGRKFVECGIKEMDEELSPDIRRLLTGQVIPKALGLYAILLWFTIEVILEHQDA